MTAQEVEGEHMESGAIWFSVAAVGCVGAGLLARRAGLAYDQVGPTTFLLLLATLAALAAAGLSAVRLVRAGVYSWLLPLGALNLLLLRPGLAGEAVTWRLEWGVMGLGWTLLAVWVFARLLGRSDELERRLHLEGAFLGLSAGLVAAVLYALFETRLPPLRGQWVAVALLLSWWGGFLLSARRYRWKA
jgi:hypothetical protein